MQITLPDELSVRLHQLAAQRRQPVAQFVVDQLRTTLDDRLAQLPSAEQAELQALRYLSDDALRAIAAKQMVATDQARMAQLMKRNNRDKLSPLEQNELTTFVDRGDQLMLRKAEAIELLHQRGYTVSLMGRKTKMPDKKLEQAT